MRANDIANRIHWVEDPDGLRKNVVWPRFETGPQRRRRIVDENRAARGILGLERIPLMGHTMDNYLVTFSQRQFPRLPTYIKSERRARLARLYVPPHGFRARNARRSAAHLLVQGQ